MFRWYNEAAICYAYLADVTTGDDNRFPLTQFCSCRWFQRGWTLQELLAPDNLRFYDSKWLYLGTKANRSSTIERRIGIPRRFLQGAALNEASVAQRMSWASRRETKREEDIAYCLLGIFDVTMPMIYGEGGDRAFIRLQREIMRNSRDESILAWGFQAAEPTTADSVDLGVSAGVLAASPADFADCGEIVPRKDKAKSPTTFTVDGGLVRMSLPLFSITSGEVFGLLDCGPQHDRKAVVGIPLSETPSGEYLRPQGRHAYMFAIDEASAPAQPVYIRIERQKKSTLEASIQNYFYIDDSIEAGLELIEVEPQDRWWKDRSLIRTSSDPADDTIQQTWTRFRSASVGSSDFLVLLEFQTQGSQVRARCHMMVAKRSASLLDIAHSSRRIRQDAFGKSGAGDGTLGIQASVERDSMQGIFVVKLAAMSTPPSITVDATFELEVLMYKSELESVMKEENDLRLEAEYLDQRKGETTSSLESIKASLTEIEGEIERLVEQKARLSDILSRASQEKGETSTRAEEIRQRRAMLSERRRSLEEKLDGRQQSDWGTGYGLSLCQTGGGAAIAVNSSSNGVLPRSTSTEHSGWVRSDKETVLSDTEVVEAEVELADLADLVETETELANSIDEMFRVDPFFQHFFSGKKGFLTYLFKKAMDMYFVPECKYIIAQTIKTCLYQQVLYCDDSSAMEREGRWDVQKELVKHITKVTTQILPPGKGVALRFINREVDNSPNLTFDRVKKIMDFMPLGLGGNNAIVTNLRSRILEPLVYNKLNSQSLDRPLLINIMIGGVPQSGAESEIIDAIKECGKKLKIAGYPRNTVTFMIYQVGTSKRTVAFLQRLQDNQDINPVTDIEPADGTLRKEIVRDKDGLRLEPRHHLI
ncbi:hypothetical protein AbraCBS73388_000729 [Aspergillus brasiliensis]|uniref:DUF8212 domain-containing protein n=1 Tax=Aspergillus brasiliensis TaxID=319629 RepID=A0A9W6DSB5_9EURO|nr:hypothetical protein AbraCBS73388_000729 [Aspergillus brasiliensis]